MESPCRNITTMLCRNTAFLGFVQKYYWPGALAPGVPYRAIFGACEEILVSRRNIHLCLGGTSSCGLYRFRNKVFDTFSQGLRPIKGRPAWGASWFAWDAWSLQEKCQDNWLILYKYCGIFHYWLICMSTMAQRYFKTILLCKNYWNAKGLT